MDIYYSMIHLLLSIRYPLIDLHTSAIPLKLNMPKMYAGTVEPGIIYVVNNTDDFKPSEDTAGSALVFCSADAVGIKLLKGSRAILIGNCHNPNEALETLNELFITLERWHGKLISLSCDYSPISVMIESFLHIFPVSIVVENENLEHLYESVPFTEDMFTIDTKYSQFIETVECHGMYSSAQGRKSHIDTSGRYQHTAIIRSLFNDDNSFIGRLVVVPDKFGEDFVPNDGCCQIVDVFGDFLEKKLSWSVKGASKTDTNTMHMSITKLFLEPEDAPKQYILNCLNAMGWSQFHTFMVAVLRMDTWSSFVEFSGYLCGHFEKLWRNCIAIRHNNSLILLFNCSVFESFEISDITNTLTVVHNDIDFKLGFSNRFQDLFYAGDFFAQCMYAIENGLKKNPDSWIFSFSDHCTDYIASYLSERFSTEFFCHPGILALYGYDEKNNTELMKTLKYFIIHKFNASHAAAAMFIHRTTFIKRIEKINKLQHLNFGSLDETLHIMLSIKLLEIEEE
ncbi:MAG: hypothetical protein GX111_10715 [Clostridiales bacterium]|nr:hypothetical protein [Clostridiales bacterium]